MRSRPWPWILALSLLTPHAGASSFVDVETRRASCLTCTVQERVEQALRPDDPAWLGLNDDGQEIVEAFEILVPQLCSGTFETRKAAMDALMQAYLGARNVPAETYDASLDALRDCDVLGRAFVVDVLESCEEDQAMDALAVALRDESPWIRMLALEGIHSWSTPNWSPVARSAVERLASDLVVHAREALASADPRCDSFSIDECRSEHLRLSIAPSIDAIEVLQAGDCREARIAAGIVAEACAWGPEELAPQVMHLLLEPACADDIALLALRALTARPEPRLARLGQAALDHLRQADDAEAAATQETEAMESTEE